MSSRSNGVTNVVLTRLMIAWVASSASCSASRIRAATSSVAALGQHLGEQLRPADEVLGRLGEEIVERAVDGAELQTHGYSW